jgi:replicative superfamily II helicase
LYLAPLKALVSEKYEDWQIRFPDKQIVILTGDYSLSENKKAALNTADIIVLTSEMLDSRTRKMETENNIFLKMAGLILVDESHILTMQDRGHAMEVALMRFTSINSYARVILLSATMPNVGELGEWLTVLNSKKSVVLYCNWRPVTLQMHYREHHVFVNSRGYPDYWATQNGKRKMAVEIAMDKLSESFLIFVHDKATGRDLISRFKKEKEVAVFHSADLEKDARKKLEDAFRSRKQRVMISTSTTAFGLNLPARNVIIVGVSRGINPVDELEIIQEAGRAGRYGIDDEGHVFLIVPEGTTFEWEHKIANPRPVNSVLNDHDVLAFHALAEITNKVIRDKRSFMEWFNRSLAAKQEILPFREENAQGLLEDLNTMEMIEYQGVSPYVTGLGKVSSWLYFSPYDVYSWYKNFNQIYASGERMDDELLAWAIADIPSNNPGYVIKAMQGVASEWQYRFRSRGFACSDAILSVIAMYEKLTDKDNVGGIVNVLKRNIIFDIERTIQALSLIDGLHAKWNQEGLWQSLPTRVKYSVPMEMVELVSIPGVGGVRAHQLWEQDLCSVEDVARAESKKLYAAVGKVVGLKIKKAAADVFAKKG